jgi:hypothetical protein
MALWLTQPLSQISTRNLPGGKGRPSMSRLSRKCGSLDVSQPCGSPLPVTGISLPMHETALNEHRDLNETYHSERRSRVGGTPVSYSEVLRSYSCWGTGYNYWAFSWSSSIPPLQFQDSNSNYWLHSSTFFNSFFILPYDQIHSELSKASIEKAINKYTINKERFARFVHIACTYTRFCWEQIIYLKSS